MLKNLLKKLPILTLILLVSSSNSLNTELTQSIKLSESEKFVKELYQKYPQTITFLKMHEVPSSLANKLNKLFTPQIQEALYKKNFKFLMNNGFEFYEDKSHIFSHKDFPEYIFKLPSPFDRNILLNPSRIWLSQWLKIIQNEFIIPDKKIFFMKSKYRRFCMVVVARKLKNFEETPLEPLNLKQRNAFDKIINVAKLRDTHEGNKRANIIVDTEALENLSEFFDNPFLIYDDPLKTKIKSKL
jgi:hypothetical protein